MATLSRTESGDAVESRGRPLRSRLVPSFLKDREARRSFLRQASMGIEIVAGMAIFIIVAPQFSGDWQLFLVLLALNSIAQRMVIPIYGDTVVTVGFVFTIALIALFGPPGAAIAAPLETVARRLGRRRLLGATALANACQGIISLTIAAWVYEMIAPINPSEPQWEMIPAGLIASIVAFSLSAIQVTLATSLRTSQSLSTVWENHRWLAVHYLGLGIVGMSLAAAYSGLGYWGILAFLTPAFMLRFAMKQYVDKTAENVEKLKEQNSALEVANIEIRKVSDQVVTAYNSTLIALVNALEARDHETAGHSLRGERYMLNIAEALGVKPGTQQWEDMKHGALLHDVGKIGVPDHILLKPDKLSPEEWVRMRMHPEIGYEILREVEFLHGAAEIVLAHHERWDGNGYPRGLKGEEIPLGSRIFAVVDTFDSMTFDRAYRKALTTQESLNEILRCSGTQFDPLVVEAFLDIYEAWVLEHEKLRAPTTGFKPAA